MSAGTQDVGRSGEQTGCQGGVSIPRQRAEAGWTSPQGDLNLHPQPLRFACGEGSPLAQASSDSRTDGARVAVGRERSWGLGSPSALPSLGKYKTSRAFSVFLHPTAHSSRLLRVSRPQENAEATDVNTVHRRPRQGPREGSFCADPGPWAWDAFL